MTHPLSSAQPVGLHLTTAQSPTVDALLATGSAHLYNLDFEEATERFEHSLSVDPDHPGPYAWLAATLWLREMHDRGDLALDGVVDASTLRRDDEDDTARDGHRAAEDARRARLDEAVFRLVAEGLSRATAWTETVPHEVDGLYYRGLLVAIRAGYRAAVMDDTAGAIGDANAAVALHERVAASAPTHVDALFIVGVYHYVAGTLPWYVKLLSYFAGVRGDADEGRRLLERVAEVGTTLRDAAQVTLAVIHLREEEPSHAAERLARLAERYPRNYLFAQNRAVALGEACEWDAASDLYSSLLSRVDAAHPNYHLADPLVLRLHWGHAAIQAGRASVARSVYARLLGEDEVPSSVRALASLGRGQAHDLLDARDAAVADYVRVLQEPDIDDSHDRSAEYLADPYHLPPRRPCARAGYR